MAKVLPFTFSTKRGQTRWAPDPPNVVVIASLCCQQPNTKIKKQTNKQTILTEVCLVPRLIIPRGQSVSGHVVQAKM